MTPRPPSGHAVVDLLEQARGCLAEAAAATTASGRYTAAHLAALRAGAAVLAARAGAAATAAGSRRPRSHGPRSVWAVLSTLAPELSEWAAFFAAGARKRAAAEAGLPGAVTGREADDLLRDADTFLSLVSETLGIPYQEPLSGISARLAG